jgi:dihydrofolate synthase/folylpolyglutamate synthase|tara:strand:+ start:122 stop:1639 length:1518 start_codon:yes stop_codon:yes gene_type:complete
MGLANHGRIINQCAQALTLLCSPFFSSPRLPVPLNDSTIQPQGDAYESALGFLYRQINYEKMTGLTANCYRFRLRRMSELLSDLGLGRFLHSSHPVPPVPLIHIAGTKGKGSVAAMAASILTASGLRTGLYTSPHLHRLEERFRVDGQICSPKQLVPLVERLRQTVDPPSSNDPSSGEGNASFFELTTALALLHFEREKCEAIVLEVGLGGRLDSTNVCAPSVSVVTSIGLDHQHVLGEDVVQIAAEKAGIIKSGVPVVSGVVDPDAQRVVRSTAAEQQSAFFQLGSDFEVTSTAGASWGSRIDYTGLGNPGRRIQAVLPLEGKHQSRNAAIAIATLEALDQQKVVVPDSAIVEGLAGLKCPGRVERFDLPDGVLAVVDVAHNEDSITALCDCLRNRFSERSIAVVFGTSVDKSAEPMLERLSEIADELVLTRFHDNSRFVDPSDLLPLLRPGWSGQAQIIAQPIDACRAALEKVSPGGILVICGSFFLAAETRRWVESVSLLSN